MAGGTGQPLCADHTVDHAAPLRAGTGRLEPVVLPGGKEPVVDIAGHFVGTSTPATSREDADRSSWVEVKGC